MAGIPNAYDIKTFANYHFWNADGFPALNRRLPTIEDAVLEDIKLLLPPPLKKPTGKQKYKDTVRQGVALVWDHPTGPRLVYFTDATLDNKYPHSQGTFHRADGHNHVVNGSKFTIIYDGKKLIPPDFNQMSRDVCFSHFRTLTQRNHGRGKYPDRIIDDLIKKQTYYLRIARALTDAVYDSIGRDNRKAFAAAKNGVAEKAAAEPVKPPTNARIRAGILPQKKNEA